MKNTDHLPASPPLKPVLRSLQGHVLPHPPLWLMRQAGRYLPEYRQIRERAGSFLDLCLNPDLAAEVTLQPVRRFQMDAAILFADILLIPYGLGQGLRFVEGEGPRLAPIINWEGISILSVDQCRSKLSPVFETVRRVRAQMPEACTLIGFAGAPWTVATYMIEGGGSREFSQVKNFAYRNPDAFALLIDRLIASTADYLIAQAEAGAEVLMIFDSWAGVLAEPDFTRYVVTPTQRVIDQVKAKFPQIPFIGFPRGAGLLYPLYTAATGVDGIGLDTTVPVSFAAETLQPLATVQGNLDPEILRVGGTKMITETRRIISFLANRAHIFNLGHGIHKDTPPDHVAELVKVVRGG